MKKLLITAAIILSIQFVSYPLKGELLLNEVSAGGNTDWVELKLTPDTPSMDISPLFVTMYYGTNEAVATSPVTLYGSDRPETPWDDRFAVIYFSSVPSADETDITGDLNNNRVRELYCANYGLWNTDCCVAIDSDDDPANNGIIDFMAFSNRDGSINTTIASYINSAINFGMWNGCASANLQDCCCFTGTDGMNSWSSLSRTGPDDSNGHEDFVLTPYSTPGRDNITSVPAAGGRILKPIKHRAAHEYCGGTGTVELPLFLYTKASLRVRIFNAAGANVYTGPLIADAVPGFLTVTLNEKDLKGKILTGLYPVSIEAVDTASGRADNFRMILVIVRQP